MKAKIKRSKSSELLLLLSLSIGLLLVQCDTTRNVESPATSYFLKYYGNNGSQVGIDFVVDNSDGSFILFGTNQIGSADPKFFLVKTDAKGNIIREVTFGSGKCQAKDVELASNGNVVVLGNNIAPGKTDYDVYLKRFTINLDPLDSATKGLGFLDYNTNQPANENATTLTETLDHGFMIAGSSDNIGHTSSSGFLHDPLLLRFDNTLQPYDSGVWKKINTFDNGFVSGATKIVQLPDATFYVFGYTTFKQSVIAQPDLDFWYFHLGTTGSPDGGVNYLPGALGNDQKLYSVFADTISSASGNGFFLGGLETDATGARLYFTKLGPPPLAFSAGDYANRISPTVLGIGLGQVNTVLNPPYTSNEFVSVARANNGFLMLTNEVSTGNSNMFLKKIDDHGNYVGDFAWGPVIFGGPGDDFAGAVQELKDGKIAIIGTMTIGQASVNNGETKMVLIKVNKDGQFAD